VRIVNASALLPPPLLAAAPAAIDPAQILTVDDR
jgi:hypothetical protein